MGSFPQKSTRTGISRADSRALLSVWKGVISMGNHYVKVRGNLLRFGSGHGLRQHHAGFRFFFCGKALEERRTDQAAKTAHDHTERQRQKHLACGVECKRGQKARDGRGCAGALSMMPSSAAGMPLRAPPMKLEA